MNNFDNFLYLNEKTIFALMFGLMLITLYIFKNESILKGFCNNIVIIFFHRIGYGYFALIEFMMHIIYCYIELEIQLNYTNVIFISVGIIFYIGFLNFFLMLFYEIPAKYLCKQLLQLKSNNKNQIKE